MTLDLAQLQKYHTQLIGKAPTKEHLTLYEAFPDYKGFSDREVNLARFEAVIVLCLSQAFNEPGQDKPNKTYLFVPANQEKWAMAQLKILAQRLFARCKEHKAKGTALYLGEVFRSLMLGSRAVLLVNDPGRWAAYGFDRKDPAPNWMRDKLLGNEP